MSEWSCCKDGVCKGCGKPLAECQPKNEEGEGCGMHFVLPEDSPGTSVVG